ncbi:ABC transporter ATP-binding protein [bacterium]|nr:ABC transporter ATP-binding protein [bacterium]
MVFIILSNLFAVFIPPIVREAVNSIASLLYNEPAPKYLKDLYEFFESPEKVALFFGALIVVSAIIKGIFMYFMRQTIIVMSRYIEFDLKNQIFKHYQNLGQRFYGSNYTGDLMNRISEDVSRVRDFAGPAVMYAINLFFMITMVLSLMFYVNTRLTLLVLIPLPILAITIYLVSDAMNKRSDRIQKKLSGLTSMAQESFSGIQVIKAFAAEKDFERDFTKEAEEYKETNMSLVKINAWFMPAVMGLVGMSVLITVYSGGKAVINDTFTLGNIAEFVIYVYMLTWPVASLGYITSLIQRAAASMARITEFLSVEPDRNEGLKTLDKLEKGIEFKNVWFRYKEEDEYVLKDISFTIPAGSKFGIIGTTGSGKSSIAKLLMGIYEPVKGEILIDGVSIHEYERTALRRLFGYVSQDIFLFSESIKDNILFGINTAADIKNLDMAIEAASLDEEIEKFPKKLETILGERGITLSGGQKQRTAIARALIKEPQILLIDDGLSAVDTKTEVKIKSALGQLSQGATFINISHRISSVQDADQIIFLDQGSIIESGNHKELMDNNGEYFELYSKQLVQMEEEEI